MLLKNIFLIFQPKTYSVVTENIIFKLIGKKIITILRSQILLIWAYDKIYQS